MKEGLIQNCIKCSCPICGHNAFFDSHVLGGYEIYACSTCTLRFAPAALGVITNYDTVYQSPDYISEQINSLALENDFKRFIKHPTYRPFFEQIPLIPGGSLLDIGCGVGRFCHAAYHFGWKVMGSDSSERAIQIGMTRATFPLVRATVEDLLTKAKRYDVVTAFEVLEHLSQPLDFLKKVRELIHPDGRFFCTVPNWACKIVQTATKADWIPPIHMCFFNQLALERLGELAGFSNIKTGIILTEEPIPKLQSTFCRRLYHVIRKSTQPLGLWLLGQV